MHSNSAKPIKGTKKKPVTKKDKEDIPQAGSKRVMVAHTIRELKIFRIVAVLYRNKRKRFGLRINLIAALCNAEY